MYGKPNFSSIVLIAILVLMSLATLASDPGDRAPRPGGAAFATGSGAAIPTGARYRAAGCSPDGNVLYVFGGQDGSTFTVLTSVQMYDPGTNTWTARADMPVALMNMEAEAVGGKIYIVGGYDGGSHTNNLLIYDIAGNSWSQTTWPNSRTPMTAAYGGKIYAFGGNPGPSNETWMYDPATAIWTNLSAPMPTAASYGAAITVGDYIYVIGGAATNDVQRFDPATNTWDASGPALPATRMNPVCSYYGGMIYAASGGGNGGDIWAGYSDTLVYDPALWPGGSWAVDTDSLPTPVVGAAHSCANSRIYSVGGTSNYVYYDVNQYIEKAGASCAGFATACTTQVDQPLSSVITNAYANQLFPDYPAYSCYVADDFTNAAPWSVSGISQTGDGWNGFSSLMNATSLNWAIYADNAGVPAGYPGDGATTPQWSLSVPPSDARVAITAGTPGGYPSNTELTLTTPFTLPSGTWWLYFYPDMNFGSYGQYGRQGSDTANNYTAKWINPGGGFGVGTGFQDWSILGTTLHDASFSICAVAGAGCAITLAPATLPDATIGLAYSQTLTASGGTGPYTYVVTSGTLPTGLTLNGSTGSVTGTPTTAGIYTFTVTATDSAACTGTATYTINVAFAFDWTFYDDLSRSQVCINSATGYYAWYVLTAPWTGTYVGKATITPTSWGYTVVEKDKPSGIRLYIYTVYNRASGSFQRPPMTTSSKLIDSDLTDDPACP